jgi:hypothetical protein
MYSPPASVTPCLGRGLKAVLTAAWTSSVVLSALACGEKGGRGDAAKEQKNAAPQPAARVSPESQPGPPRAVQPRVLSLEYSGPSDRPPFPALFATDEANLEKFIEAHAAEQRFAHARRVIVDAPEFSCLLTPVQPVQPPATPSTSKQMASSGLSVRIWDGANEQRFELAGEAASAALKSAMGCLPAEHAGRQALQSLANLLTAHPQNPDNHR